MAELLYRFFFFILSRGNRGMENLWKDSSSWIPPISCKAGSTDLLTPYKMLRKPTLICCGQSQQPQHFWLLLCHPQSSAALRTSPGTCSTSGPQSGHPPAYQQLLHLEMFLWCVIHMLYTVSGMVVLSFQHFPQRLYFFHFHCLLLLYWFLEQQK